MSSKLSPLSDNHITDLTTALTLGDSCFPCICTAVANGAFLKHLPHLQCENKENESTVIIYHASTCLLHIELLYLVVCTLFHHDNSHQITYIINYISSWGTWN